MPPLLKALYSEIGNGGFGPSHGFLPLFTPRNRRGRGEGAIDWALLNREGDLVEEDFFWPPMPIPILDWGCAVRSSVGCSDPDLGIMRDDPNRRRPVLEAPRMEQWLLDWLDGKDLFKGA